MSCAPLLGNLLRGRFPIQSLMGLGPSEYLEYREKEKPGHRCAPADRPSADEVGCEAGDPLHQLVGVRTRQRLRLGHTRLLLGVWGFGVWGLGFRATRDSCAQCGTAEHSRRWIFQTMSIIIRDVMSLKQPPMILTPSKESRSAMAYAV